MKTKLANGKRNSLDLVYQLCYNKGMAKKLNLIRKVVSFTKSQKTDLTCIAGDMGITVSELLRRIIDEWLSRQSKESGG